ncbi:unnamed protein product [Symbiodinium sp. CCMP2456]|nr:unnamed protein product [Symbiodinium sp. CCMP2456]
MATSELDSEVEFKRRALQLGVSSSNIDSLIASGFKTFGQYAFSVPNQPGSADESPLVDLLTSSLSGEPDAGQLSCLRRLFWEAHGLAVRDLRLRQEHGSDSASDWYHMVSRDGALAQSLAMDLAGLASFQVSEAWHTYLFTVREREVPKNMRPVTLQQILDADKRLWVLLAEEVRGKIVARPGANPTCDAVIERLCMSNDVLSYLSPQHELRQPTLPRWEPYTPRGRGRGKGKDGKDKGKTGKAPSTESAPTPPAIPEGAHSTTPEGKPLCFLYSRGKCWAKKKAGQRCAKGFHLCWFCLKEHPGCECPTKGALSEGDIVKLFDLLPKEEQSGARDAHKLGHSFTTGLYARVKVALRRNSRLFPNSTKVLASFVTQVHPSHKFSSIIIFDSVETSVHTDALNAPGDNLVVGLSDFSGGDLWVEWPANTPRTPGLSYENRNLGNESVLGFRVPSPADLNQAGRVFSQEGSLAAGFRKIGWDTLAIVQNENKLFCFCARVLRWALDKGVLVCLEAPEAPDPLRFAFSPTCRICTRCLLPATELPPSRGIHGAFDHFEGSSFPGSGSLGGSGSVTSESGPSSGDKVPVGIYATPAEFVERARALQHPMAGPSSVTDSFKKALFANLTRSPVDIVRARASFMEKVKNLADQLQPDEEKLHASFSPELQSVLKGKRLLLFRKLLEMYNYDDPQVWKLLRDGPTLTGCQDHPPYAEHRYRPAAIPTEQLERESSWRRRLISSKTILPVGPYRSEAEVTAALGRSDWVATPRFVLLQGSKAKPRVIDDCRASGLNSSFSSSERLRLQDLDCVVAMIKLTGRMACKRYVRLDLSSGETLCGDRVLHLVVLCHHDEGGKPLYYISESLPFGADGSVYGFVRVSRAISFLINEALLVPSSVYFDDFPSLSPRATAKSATDGISFLLKALGWKFSTDPDKAKDFDRNFDVLGCTLDLSGLVGPFGFLEVGNKPGRIDHIVSLLDELGSGRGDLRLVPVLQGQLNFASNFVLGRAVSPLARALSSASSLEIPVLCEKIKSLLQRSSPRKVSWHSPDAPILIFTDAAFEGGVATMGAVVIDTMGGTPDIFDGTLPTAIVSSWQRYDDEQIICQAELAAAVCIRYRLRARLAGRKCIYFIDNESARFTLIRAVSGVPSMQALASLFHLWDEDHPHYAWVERVPSSSNPADLPSRGCIDDCVSLVNGRYSGGLVMPPGSEGFDPLGSAEAFSEDSPPSLVTLATSKD